MTGSSEVQVPSIEDVQAGCMIWQLDGDPNKGPYQCQQQVGTVVCKASVETDEANLASVDGVCQLYRY